jgi:hypothetical protein
MLGREIGDQLTLTAQTLRKRLNERGLLPSTDQGRHTLMVRRTLEGQRRDVLHLNASTLELPDKDKHKPAPERQKPNQLTTNLTTPSSVISRSPATSPYEAMTNPEATLATADRKVYLAYPGLHY